MPTIIMFGIQHILALISVSIVFSSVTANTAFHNLGDYLNDFISNIAFGFRIFGEKSMDSDFAVGAVTSRLPT